ncbi:MAG: response regulator transcription factor [Deltaproteobacteria bacterium]|nr:response regulator transcription factor [Deltaproteobacteria bacterium]
MTARSDAVATFGHDILGGAPVRIRVLLVHRNDRVRRELRRILEDEPAIHVIGEARDVDAARAPASDPPHVVVTDAAAPAARGSAIGRAATAPGDPGVVLVARRVHPESLRDALRSGALGYVIEDSIASDLVSGVRAAAARRRYLSARAEQLLVDGCLAQAARPSAADPVARLTGREREILQLIGEGRRPQEIARLLGIARTTVGTHRRSLMTKLGLHNVAQIVRFAMRSRMVS